MDKKTEFYIDLLLSFIFFKGLCSLYLFLIKGSYLFSSFYLALLSLILLFSVTFISTEFSECD